jgi:non-ribosomal peptide synthetase component F
VRERTNYPLTLTVVPGGELRIRAGYDARRFEAATIERLLGHLRTILEGMAAGLDRRLEALSMLTATEQEQLLRQWNSSRPRPAAAAREERDDDAGPPLIEVERLSEAELDSLLGTLLMEPEGDWS